VAGYMIFYSIGSALGAAASTLVYARAGWPGVCLAGCAISMVAMVFWWLTRNVTPDAPGPAAQDVEERHRGSFRRAFATRQALLLVARHNGEDGILLKTREWSSKGRRGRLPP
jgi:cyanate permease